MTELINRLISENDEKYKAFNERIVNTKLPLIGVRVPKLRAIAKDYYLRIDDIFESLKGRTPYYEEIAVLGIVISRARLALDKRKAYILKWLEYVDSWALTDSAVYQPKRDESDDYFDFLITLTRRGEEFFVRYGVVGLFKYVGDNPTSVLEAFKKLEFGAYYVDMAAAWGLCEILIKSYDIGLNVIENKCFPRFVHNKAIQKATESYRISEGDKVYLKSLKY